MNSKWFILFINDRDETVCEAGPFTSEKEMKEVRYCLRADCGLKLVMVERVACSVEQTDYIRVS